MDKQMIEEMAMKIIMAGDMCRKMKDCDGCKYSYIVDSKLCESHLFAEELLKYYQPKIPEGAVVLTNENEIKQYEWSKMLDKIGVFEFADKVRKETAEKFAERVKMAFYYHFDELIPSIMAKDIDEICKEITEDK